MKTMGGRLSAAWVPAACLALTFAPATARAQVARGHTYVIAVGYNGVPADSDVPIEPLRYADDDAIAFASFFSDGAEQTHLLTVVDADTQRRLGASVPLVEPPSRPALLKAVTDVRRALDADARAGVATTVYIYYSGHGVDEIGHPPALALLDAELTRSVLYDDILAVLPATTIHLFVDACHAEDIVRPRDAQAALAVTTPQDVSESALNSTLARFPNVGAVVGATGAAQTHEWSVYAGGVFTHELLSGLRGAADVNGDGRIEYSEIAAFLSAANGAVTDPRARLDPVVHAPLASPRAAIVDLDARVGDAVLVGRPGRHGLLSVEDGLGNRLVDLRAETDYRARLFVPPSRVLYVHSERGEATVRPSPGDHIALEALAFSAEQTADRGSMEVSLRRGLFATPFGRSYYRGFVDRATDLVAEPVADNAALDLTGDVQDESGSNATSRTVGWVALSSGAALAVGAGVFGGLALDAKSAFDSTTLQRTAEDAANRYSVDATAFVVLAGCAAAASAVGTYFLVRSGKPAVTTAGFVPAKLSFAF